MREYNARGRGGGVSRQTDEMHIQAKFKSHLDFSRFVPKRHFVLPLDHPLVLPFCLGLSRAVSLPAQSPFLSLSSSSIVSLPPPLTSTVTSFLSLLLSSLFPSRDGFPSGLGRATSSSLLSAASRNHSRWNRG